MHISTVPLCAAAIVALLAAPALSQPLGPNLVANAGFEEGAIGWHFAGPYAQVAGAEAGPGAAIIATEARDGKQSLRIDTRGRTEEINAVSDAMPVEPGVKYAISSFVRLVTPDFCGFKVTIDWLGADGKHLRYDNDWQGQAAGHEWLAHGGNFTAPDDATQARIILGILPDAAMLFDDIALRAVGAYVEITSLATSSAICIANQADALQCVVRNSGGRKAAGIRGTVGVEGSPQSVTVGDLAPDEERVMSVDIRPTATGIALARAQFTADNAPVAETAAPIVTIAESAKPTFTITSGSAELRFVESGFGHGVIEVAARDGASPRVLGAIRALAEVRIDGEPPRLIYANLRKEGDAARGEWDDDLCKVVFHFAPAAPGWFSVRCELTAKRDFALRVLTCPEFHFGWRAGGARKDSALFCGLEYLTANEESSGTESVVRELAARFVPHPNRVTVPLMAVALDGWAAGLAWNPLQRWDGQHDRPSAAFASPNRLDAQDDSLMALFVPGVPDYVDENARAAARPYLVRAGRTIVLESELFVLRAPRNVCDVMPNWYRTHPLPGLPDIGRNQRALWARSVQGLMRGWSEERKGWKPEAHRDPAFYPDIAMRLWNFGIHNRGDVAKRALAQVQEAVDSVTAGDGAGRLGLELALHVGHVKENLGGLAAGAGVIGGQGENGSWPFAPSEQTKTLGKPGDTALGICCEPILHLLNVAKRTGHKRSLDAAIKGLDYVETHFRRPAGGETWEVPLHAPNLRAAALAVECGITAYEMTGDRRYLNMARYWARAGLPFIYTWRAGDREAMRFASISVFGATFYTWPWFGRAVQWVGMVYSQALQRLARYDQSLPWAHISEGIVLSCIQQERMAERPDAGNPWPGAFPDSYSLLDGRVYGAWIGPQTIVYSLENLLDAPANDVAFVGERPAQIRVISAARVVSTSLRDGRLTVALRYPAGRTCHSVMTCISRPTRVVVDDAEIPEAADLDQASAGWWADATHQYLVIKHPARADEVHLAVEGVSFVKTDIRAAAEALVNAGFEQGMAGWSGDGSIATGDAHSEARALLIDGLGAGAEQQVYSEVFKVRPDVEYTLGAWIKLLSEKTGYKVTINWLDAEGQHIRYDNDWRGNDRPRHWTPHGGAFRSPQNADRAQLILRAQPGVEVLMDDITFAVQ